MLFRSYFEIKNIIISILLVVIVIILLNPKGCIPGRTKTITFTKVDSIPYPVHDTIPQEVEVEVEVPVEVTKEVRVEVPVVQVVDSQAIVKLFSENKQTKKDILELPGNIGTVTIFDTISNNRILGRSFTSKVKQKIVRDTIRTPEPIKRYYYAGIDAKFDKPNHVTLLGASVLMRTKNENIYRVGIGVQNITGPDRVNGVFVPYIGGGVYWKIGKK